jgi:hypothetical protein
LLAFLGLIPATSSQVVSPLLSAVLRQLRKLSLKPAAVNPKKRTSKESKNPAIAREEGLKAGLEAHLQRLVLRALAIEAGPAADCRLARDLDTLIANAEWLFTEAFLKRADFINALIFSLYDLIPKYTTAGFFLALIGLSSNIYIESRCNWLKRAFYCWLQCQRIY